MLLGRVVLMRVVGLGGMELGGFGGGGGRRRGGAGGGVFARVGVVEEKERGGVGGVWRLRRQRHAQANGVIVAIDERVERRRFECLFQVLTARQLGQLTQLPVGCKRGRK